MNSVVESSELQSRKDPKPNLGWENVFKTNRARAVAKKKSLMKGTHPVRAALRSET